MPPSVAVALQAGALRPAVHRAATDAQLADACLSLRHDFGLLEGDERERVANTMRLHWQAVWKAVSATGPGLDELLDTQVPIGSIGRGIVRI